MKSEFEHTLSTYKIFIESKILPDDPNKELPEFMIFDQPVTVGDLIDLLGLDKDQIGLVIVDGIVKNFKDFIPYNAHVSFYRPMEGG